MIVIIFLLCIIQVFFYRFLSKKKDSKNLLGALFIFLSIGCVLIPFIDYQLYLSYIRNKKFVCGTPILGILMSIPVYFIMIVSTHFIYKWVKKEISSIQ
jgi:hypothetical protein